uniref:Ig-like domain-containing protein n=1 Tax=Gopherus agassizii TaxID=38772 RepID=A0A452J264_9SAUR
PSPALTAPLRGRMTDGLNWAGHEFLKPTIWVSPSRVVALGRNVTIRCEGQDLGMEFVLCKAGHPNQQVQSVVPEGKMAEFPIASVGQEDGGSYTCYYRSITDQSHWSFPSNPVEIIVGEPSYPKPNISGIPRRGVSVGEAMAIWCRRQRQGVRFVLNKEGRHFPPVDSDGFGAVFPISNVSREDGGNYSCSYHSRSEPFAVSDPSDPMELPSYPKPNISGIPRRGVSVGEAMAIWCRRQRQGVRFVLNKEGRHFPPVDSDGFGAVFPISNVSREDGGNYSCSYHSRSEPHFLPLHPQEPNPGADRLTYAELDNQVLQAKRGAKPPAPEPAQPSMYAAINVNWGARGKRPPQSWGTGPQGATDFKARRVHPDHLV